MNCIQRDLRDVRALVRHTIESPLDEECVQKIPDSKVTVVTTNYDQRQSPFQMTSTPDPEIVQISTPEGPQTKEEPVEEEESANLAIYSCNHQQIRYSHLLISTSGDKVLDRSNSLTNEIERILIDTIPSESLRSITSQLLGDLIHTISVTRIMKSQR